MAIKPQVAATYSDTIVSAFDVFKPEILSKMFSKYGHQGQPWFLTLQQMGWLLPTGQRTYSHYEGEKKNPTFFPLANVGAPGTNTDQLVTLSAADVDTNNRYYPRVGFMVWYPNGRKGRIMSIDVTVPSAPVLTIAPLGTTSGFALPAVTTATELSIQDSAFGEGTGQPVGIVPSATKVSNNTQIFKDTLSATGSNMTSETWFNGWINPMQGAAGANGDGPGKAWYNLNFGDLEYRMMLQISAALIHGIADDGRNVDTNGERTYSTQGIIPTVRASGNIQTYTPGAFSITDFDAYTRILDRNYVDGFVGMLNSTNLYNEIKNAAVAYFANTIMDYKTGRAVMRDAFGDSGYDYGEGNEMNIDVELLKTGGRTYVFKRMLELSNPQTFGTVGSVTNGMGLVVPLGKTKDAKSGLMVDNLGARYKALDGYSRKMEIWEVGGAGNGPKVTDLDNRNWYMRSEIGNHTMGANQMILITT